MPARPTSAGKCSAITARQFLDDIRAHAVILRPRRLRRIEIETGAFAELPVAGRLGNAGAARAGVGRNQHQALFRGQALGPGLDDEGLFVAGQAGEEVQHRHPRLGRLRRQVHRETHRRRAFARGVAIHVLGAAEALLRGNDLEGHAGGLSRSPRCGSTCRVHQVEGLVDAARAASVCVTKGASSISPRIASSTMPGNCVRPLTPPKAVPVPDAGR